MSRGRLRGCRPRARSLALLAACAGAAREPRRDFAPRGVPLRRDRGVLVYAVGERYVASGRALVASIRAHDRGLAILFAHAGDGAPPAGDDALEVRRVADPFAAYPAAGNFTATQSLRLGRFDQLRASPFPLTLYSDADALACRSLDRVFDALGAASFAFVRESPICKRSPTGAVACDDRRERRATTLFKGIFKDSTTAEPPPGHPFANAGTLLYRPAAPDAVALFEAWRWLYGYAAARGEARDQPSLWVATSLVRGLRFRVLDDTVACREHSRRASCAELGSLAPPTNLRYKDADARECVFLHGHRLEG